MTAFQDIADHVVAELTEGKENPKDAQGRKKPSPQFIPPSAILHESVVMALGAAKYGAFNWNDHPVKMSVYYSAALRHLFQMWTGEDVDPESRALHAAHVRACMGIIIDAMERGNLIDDRPKTASASAVIARFQQT